MFWENGRKGLETSEYQSETFRLFVHAPTSLWIPMSCAVQRTVLQTIDFYSIVPPHAKGVYVYIPTLSSKILKKIVIVNILKRKRAHGPFLHGSDDRVSILFASLLAYCCEPKWCK